MQKPWWLLVLNAFFCLLVKIDFFQKWTRYERYSYEVLLIHLIFCGSKQHLVNQYLRSGGPQPAHSCLRSKSTCSRLRQCGGCAITPHNRRDGGTMLDHLGCSLFGWQLCSCVCTCFPDSLRASSYSLLDPSSLPQGASWVICLPACTLSSHWR